MPFITEEIFCNIQDEEESIMISSWPVYDETNNFAAEEKAIETIKEAVRNIRNLRADMNVAPSRKALVYVVTASEDVKNIFNNSLGFFGTLAYASEVKFRLTRLEYQRMLFQQLYRMLLSIFLSQSLLISTRK